MTRFLKISILTVIGGAVLAPPFAFAHSGDLLLARLVLHPSAEVTLEITADLAANPHLKNTPNPAAALGDSLRVHLPGGRSWKITELGKPTVYLRDGFQSPAPVPLEHSAGEKTPELYTASWTWRASETPLRFEVPAGNPQTVIFWHVGPDSEAVAPGWKMLLAGDGSNPIALPVRPTALVWNWKAILALSFAGLGLGLQGMLLVRKLKTKPLR